MKKTVAHVKSIAEGVVSAYVDGAYEYNDERRPVRAQKNLLKYIVAEALRAERLRRKR